MNDAAVRRDLRNFEGRGYVKGRPIAWQVAWMFVSGAFASRWWCPPRLRASILRAFGASIGERVLIRHGVRIHWPWKLTIGDDTWVGEGAYLLNLEPITIGNNVCISQQALICTGSHDVRSPTFEFDNGPIVIGNGAWIAARAVVLRGVHVGDGAVVGASALVARDVPAGATVLAPVAVTRTSSRSANRAEGRPPPGVNAK